MKERSSRTISHESGKVYPGPSDNAIMMSFSDKRCAFKGNLLLVQQGKCLWRKQW